MTALAMKWGQEDYPWVSQEARSTWVARNERAFAQLRDAIARLPTKPTAWPDETLHARTLDAIVGLDDGTTSPQDVAALATPSASPPDVAPSLVVCLAGRTGSDTLADTR